jgi:acyl CoA:acetate/3-ketoacid CoA transferase alpha subunit/acyl CoA:acetate/3-ketoacid CoA transferase beta subunit
MDTEAKRRILQLVEIPHEGKTNKVMPLGEAITRYVRPGMTLHFSYASTSCYALIYEIARQFWGTRPEFTVIALGLLGPQAFMVHGGLVKKIISTFLGNSYPSPGPNPIYQRAIKRGAIDIENWSLLSYTLRLKAGAFDCGFLPTRSIVGSSMEEDNQGAFQLVDDPFQPGKKIGVVQAMKPDISLCHCLAADPDGNAILTSPLSENIYGAMASKEGVVLTVEKIVSPEFIRNHAHLVRIPGYLVRSVSEVPFGAHPAALNSYAIPEIEGYGIDVEFQIEAGRACKEEKTIDGWVQHWVLDCRDHMEYLKRLGTEKILYLKGKARRDAWFYEFEGMADRIQDTPEPTPAEKMIVAVAHKLMERIRAGNYHTILAGIGASSLAAWLATYFLKDEGRDVNLMAELGFYGYLPRPMDPYIFNHANIPTCKMTSDNCEIMGILLSGNPNACIGSLAAGQIDRHGNINTTKIPPDTFITGSGGGNDVASSAREILVTALQSKGRYVERVPYITSPGIRVRTLVSDKGVFEKPEGKEEFILTRYLPSEKEASKEQCIQEIRASCGWDLEVAEDVCPLPLPLKEELSLLRSFDPMGHFLR